MLTKIIFTTLIFSIVTSAQVFSQHMSATSNNTEGTPNGITIHEDDFICFQDLLCVKKKNPFTRSNLDDVNLSRNRYQTYVVEGASRDEEVYAVYDDNGRLLKASLTQRNIKLPVSIKEALKEGSFANWKVIGSELTVENFDRRRMQYKVVLQNDDLVRVMNFDRHGNILNHLS